MNRERAETHLRLLAEAELRHTAALRADGTMSQRHVPSLALAATPSATTTRCKRRCAA